MPQQINTSPEAGDTLYYDGACPICSREISKLKSLDRGGLRCVDLSDCVDETQAHSISTPSKEAMMRRLHLQTEEGTWLIGLRANIYAWRNTRYAKMWRLLTLPLVFPVANAAYEFWAARRFKKSQQVKAP